MELALGIHRIVVGEAASPGMYATNTYLLMGSHTSALVDTGWNREEDIRTRLDYIQQMGTQSIAAIIITHRHLDHMGGASAIHQATGGPIITAPAEKESIESNMKGVKVERVVEDGEILDLGDLTLEFIHAPGHTLGSLGVLIRENKALFTGDNVMGRGTSVINPGEGDMGLYLDTMEKFLGYAPETIYPGHGPPVSDPEAKLQGLIGHRKEREQQILDLLKQETHTVEDLLRAIYDELAERVQNLARNQILSHLAKLEKDGLVVVSGRGSYQLR